MKVRVVLAVCAPALLLLAFSSTALAIPFHARAKALDVSGLNHACGAAVDSKGDLYLSSAGESKVNVYDPSHTLLTSISNANTPCGLAVTSTGNLYVSEQASGEVVRYKPNAYPFSGTPSYGSREVIDASGKAKGIAVDRFDNRLYVAEGTKVAVYDSTGTFEANVGEGMLTEASGVASYTYRLPGTEVTYHYLWAADANGLLPDRLKLFSGQSVSKLSPRTELTGSTTPDGSFGFGAKGAYLAADPGNRNSEGKCLLVGEQACTEGHLFLYDATHKALDEFDASGEYLDQTKNAAFADAEPSAVAIERSGGSNDGTVYVTAGAGSGAKALAFGPLKAPSRKVLKKPSEEAGGLSQELAAVTSVTVGANGYLYASQASLVHVYKPNGTEVKTEGGKTLLEDKFETKGAKPFDLAVDSKCNVYVLDERGGFQGEELVAYYTPSACPPTSSTTYTRHEVTNPTKFPAKDNLIQAIAINPGPSSGKDRLFVTTRPETQEYDSAANGSALLNKEFAAGLNLGNRQSIAVNGANGNVWFGANPKLLSEIDPSGKELLSQLENTGAANGKIGFNPFVAVDQSNGHVITFDGSTSSAREYDAAGSFVAQFGSFTEGLVKPYTVAVDNSCAIQGLTGSACEAADPANGTVYVAFDDTSASHPPYDINAFGPLTYPPSVKHKLTVERKGTGSGTVTSSPAGINCGSTCSAEFDETEVVTLTAIPAGISEFVKWTGCEAETVSPTEGICEVTMDEAKKVVAEFTEEEGTKHKLTLKKTGSGKGVVTSDTDGIDCKSECTEASAEFTANSTVTLTAIADKGSEVVKWTGCDAEPSPSECEVTMSADKEVKVEFGPEHPLLTVIKEGSGSGKVTSSPAGIDCGSTCTHKFNLGDEVTLTAEADPGSVFAGWTGCDSEPSGTECEVEMSEPRQVTAAFAVLPQVIAKQASPVLYDEATLHGEIDPGGLATEYRFEYLTEEEYEDNGGTFEGAQKTPKGELAPAKGLVAVEAPLVGLEEGTEYRFRLRAMNSVGPAEDEGPPFETLQRSVSPPCPNAAYRFGLSAQLPDCRAYELVTPAQTNGLSPYATGKGNSPSRNFSNWLTPQSGEAAGERLSYFTDGTLPGFEGNGVIDGYRAERAAGDHPAGGWQSTLFSPTYRQGDGAANQLGVSSDQLYSIFEIASKSLTFPETLPDGIYLRTPTGFEALATDPGARSAYASAGGTHAIFSSRAHLDPAAPPAPIQAIYDQPAGSGSPTVVSTPPTPGLKAQFESNDASFAGTSEDGDAVVFKVNGALYLNREGQTSPIAPDGIFAGISENGRYVFYGAGGSAGNLFRFDTQSEEVTEIAKTGIFALVSPDGSHAFFSSEEVLTGAEENENGEVAKAGERNLYVWDGTSVRFVGRLATPDFEEGAVPNVIGGFGGNTEMNLAAWTRAISLGLNSGRAYAPTRSTQSGGAFVFQSHARLTAYDNEGVGEIYRFDPSAPEGEQLLCISCDPTGASPSADALLEDLHIATGSPVNSRTMIANLTNDGQKVFFQSFDRLLPEDVNETEDVYEWKAKGAGECTRVGGCLALISSGQGEVPSYLYAMSADGRDVFIQTREKLVGSDVAGSPSIYDAREGGGIPEPAEAQPCQGDACQGQGSEPPTLPAPATTGAGESPEGGPVPKPCGKGKHRVKGRCVVSKHKHRKHHRRVRTTRGGSR